MPLKYRAHYKKINATNLTKMDYKYIIEIYKS